MPVILLHKDVAPHRTCTKNKPSKQITMADTAPHCGGKNCITCKAKLTGCQMLETDFDIDESTAIRFFVEMKEGTSYKDMTMQEKVEKLSGWMASMIQSEKKALAAMGAIRLSQKQAIHLLKGQTVLDFIH
eukprot:13280122-Heterocapsa_arctica.AAC.1